MTTAGLDRRIVEVLTQGRREGEFVLPGGGDQRSDDEGWSMPGQLIITIDGPAGTGKSSVARALARRLGLAFLDTGAMYRAAALIAIEQGIDPLDPERARELIAAVEAAHMHFDWAADPPDLLCAGVSVMRRIREADVTRAVSPVAAIAGLRRDMVRKQRAIAAAHPRLVSEGRDQGSVVFPDAAVKFYLDATPEVRARRRLDQLRSADGGAAPALSTEDAGRVLREIIARDEADAGRADGPLVCPPDAERIDTSDLAFDEVVLRLERFVRGHVRGVRAAGFPSPGSTPRPGADWSDGGPDSAAAHPAGS